MTTVLALSCACVTCCSSMASDTYDGMTAEYGISREVATLSISLFVAGLGVGPCESALDVDQGLADLRSTARAMLRISRSITGPTMVFWRLFLYVDRKCCVLILTVAILVFNFPVAFGT